MNKDELVSRIDNLKGELERLNIKEQTFTEMIAHLRSRVNKVERRKREIHDDVRDLKDKVNIWFNQKGDKDEKESRST